jgi:hypothetical protein
MAKKKSEQGVELNGLEADKGRRGWKEGRQGWVVQE